MTEAVGDQEFHRELAAAVRAMQVGEGAQGTLDQAVRSVCDLIEACDAASISIVSRRGVSTPAATAAEGRRADELQHELQQGPLLDAIRDREAVRSDDLAIDERWPVWAPKVAAELGLGSSLSFRLFVTDDATGALTLYSRTPHGFDDTDVYQGISLAAHIAVAVASAVSVDNLERAVVTRTVIGQAVGILMERFTLPPERAFEVLLRISSHRNTKLHLVAEELVQTRITPQ